MPLLKLPKEKKKFSFLFFEVSDEKRLFKIEKKNKAQLMPMIGGSTSKGKKRRLPGKSIQFIF